MSTEQKILEQILKEGGNASVGLIAKKLKMNNGHIDYLCKVLLKKGLIKKMEKNTWYQVVHEGKKIEETGNPEAADRRLYKEEPKISPHPVVKRRKQQAENRIKQENKETRIQKMAILLKKKPKRLVEFLKNFINRRRAPKIL